MMSDDDNDGQMIFGDPGGLKFPNICLTGEEKPRKNLTQETCPDWGLNPGAIDVIFNRLGKTTVFFPAMHLICRNGNSMEDVVKEANQRWRHTCEACMTPTLVCYFDPDLESQSIHLGESIE